MDYISQLQVRSVESKERVQAATIDVGMSFLNFYLILITY